MKNQVWSVSALVKYLKSIIDNDMNLRSILIKGEISNFTNHRSGHLYFSLKDNGARMQCVMFSSYASKLKIPLKEGMKVIVSTKVSLYEPQGNLQLYVTAVQSDGIGDLFLQFEQLKEKLANAGLFEEVHKKVLNEYPMDIGIIAAKTGAAIQDVLAIIARRWPICSVRVYPSLVQGEQASRHLIENLKKADQNKHDAILLVRGGGSIEDLWCFNDEALAYTIFQMDTYIVSGVGHETDTTLVDYVSDCRAPTPSAAAELITPDIEELRNDTVVFKKRLYKALDYQLKEAQKQLRNIKNKPMFQNSDYFIQNDKLRLMMVVKGLYGVEKTLQQYRYAVDERKETLVRKMHTMNDHYQQIFKTNVSLLDAFSPLKVLYRGYSIALKGTKAIRSVKDVEEHDRITIRVNDGQFNAIVEKGER